VDTAVHRARREAACHRPRVPWTSATYACSSVDGKLMGEACAEVPEFAPPLLDPDDPAAIRAHLDRHGFAVVPALSAAELAEAEDLLWAHLEGREEAGSVTQRRPLGWKREDVATWREGFVAEGTNDGFLYSTCHCRSMWHVRSRPGLLKAFEAA